MAARATPDARRGVRRGARRSRARTAPTRRCSPTPASTRSTSRCPTRCTSSGPCAALRGGQARAVREADGAPTPRRSSEPSTLAERRGLVLTEAFMWRHHPQRSPRARARSRRARSASCGSIRVVVRLPARATRATRACEPGLDGGGAHGRRLLLRQRRRALAGARARARARPSRSIGRRRRRRRGSRRRCASPATCSRTFDCALDAPRARRARGGRRRGLARSSTTRGTAASAVIERPRAGRLGGARSRSGRRTPYALELEDFAGRGRAASAAPLLGRDDAVGQARTIAALLRVRDGGTTPGGPLRLKTSLGIWALGPMVTRFVPGGYQPEHAGETTRREGAPRRRRPRGPRSTTTSSTTRTSSPTDNLDEVRAALDDHDIYCVARGCTSTRASAAAGSSRPTRRSARRLAAERTVEAADFAGRARRALHHLARDRGLQLPVPDALRGVLGVAHRGHRARPRRCCDGHGRQALPRAQELRARDEDPHGQHRDDAARHPQAARPGLRQRPGQHGLAAPDHERREPRRVRRAARRRGAARPPARELGLGHVRRRQHGRRDGVHGDDRARDRAAPRGLRRATASASASTSTRTPRTRSGP